MAEGSAFVGQFLDELKESRRVLQVTRADGQCHG